MSFKITIKPFQFLNLFYTKHYYKGVPDLTHYELTLICSWLGTAEVALNSTGMAAEDHSGKDKTWV